MAKIGLIDRLARLIFPVDCLSCGAEGEWLCDECLWRQRKPTLSHCVICAQAAETGICRGCQEKTGLDGAISLLSYSQAEARELIKQAKYHGYRDALSFIASRFRRSVERLLPEDIELISFTPTSRLKLKERGFNPAEVVAQSIFGSEEVRVAFEKTKETPSQTGLNKKERARNVRGAYRIREKHLSGAVVIVDDVITTGATLGVLAKLAKRAGAKEVWAVTICHG